MSDKIYLINNEEIMKEWNWEKNKELGLDPDKITYGSIRNVWWICKYGHEWSAKPNSRITKDGIRGCPYCSGRYAIKGINDLATTNSELIKEWNYEKNSNIKPEEVKAQSNKKVWWKCKKCNYEWEALVCNRTKGSGCPRCSNENSKLNRKIPKDLNKLLKNTNPELIEEWNYERNNELGLKLENITYGSTKKVWWKCKDGHEWQASVGSRSLGTKCPYCSNQKVMRGYNDIATTNPELLKEWNYERNIDLTPEMITKGYSKKIWWKCEKGHEWLALISGRRRGTNCPFCSNQKVLEGYNDLATINPNLAREWNYERNGNLRPNQVIPGSAKKVWWKCERGHEWQASIVTRNKNHNCPECLKGLRTSLPEQCIYHYIYKYFPDAINTYKPEWLKGKEIDIYIPSLKLGIEYDGDAWHKETRRDIEKTNLILNNGIKLIRIREPKCPDINDNAIYIKTGKYDSNLSYISDAILEIFKIINKEYNLKIIANVDIENDYYEILNKVINYEKENNLLIKYPDISKEWNYERNINLYPEQFASGSEILVWWKCERGHEWQTSPYNRIRGSNCPYCSNHKVLKGFNDIKTTNPELTKEWNYEKNGKLIPEVMMAGSNKKVWWKCEKGHEWQASLNARTSNNTGCPICANRKIIKGINDLRTTNPELVEEWSFEKNNIKPEQIVAGSGKKVWWRCKNGHEWQAAVNNRIKGIGCPYCAGKKAVIGINDLQTTNFELAKQWNYEKNGKLTPQMITSGSGRKVWWKCENGHEWQSSISNRVKGSGCPYCSGRNSIVGETDLKTLYPNLVKEWNYTRNGSLTPEQVTIGSGKKVWWKCENGHEWEASIYSRVKGFGKCKICKK